MGETAAYLPAMYLSLAHYAEIEHPELDQLHADYHSRFGEPLVGTKRATYVDRENSRVFKVPLNMAGIDANYAEDGHTDDFIPLAPCRILDLEAEFPVLEMEWVEPVIGPRSELPDWTDWVDCAQVGLTTDGRLVAYDL